MTRTLFSTMTERASRHLQGAHAALTAAESPAPQSSQRHELAARASEHRDLTHALAHLGRTVRGRGEARPDPATDRLILALDGLARPRTWSEGQCITDPVVSGLREASRSIRAAADLWATHRSPAGRPRSPEAARLRHPSMQGAAVRHWQALVEQSATLAAELLRVAGSSGPDISDLAHYPRPVVPARDLAPVPLPLARPGATAPADAFEAIDDRVDRIHRHVWELAQEQRMSSAVLINAAAIGMLLARAALLAEQRAQRGVEAAAASGPRTRVTEALRAQSVTQGDLELWASAAAGLSPVRTPDAPTTVLQVERLDLARLLERALARHSTGTWSPSPTVEVVAGRLTQACVSYRAVATSCASSIRMMHEQGLLFLAGRHLPKYLIARHQGLVAARLDDLLVPAPTVVARRLEAQLHAISAAVQPSEGSVA